MPLEMAWEMARKIPQEMPWEISRKMAQEMPREMVEGKQLYDWWKCGIWNEVKGK